MGIKIEKGVPIELSSRRRAHFHLYPWKEMEVGDSFFVLTDKPNNFTRNVYSQRKNGLEFKYAILTDGVRVWRVK